MIAKFFLLIILLYCIYAFFAQEKYHLIFIIFIISSNFFGFQPFLGDKKDDVIFLYLILLWTYFYFFHTYKTYIIPAVSRNIVFVYIFLGFLVLILFFSIINYHQALPSFKVFRQIFRYSSMVFFIYIFLHFNKGEMDKFIDLIEKITVALCFLYILDFGVGLKIFAVKSYGEGAIIGGVSIERNFQAIPQFLLFTFVRILLRERYDKYVIFSLIVISLTIFFTYTRSLILSSLAIAVVSLFVRNIKYSKDLFKLIKILSLAAVLIVIVVFTIQKMFPYHLQYLMFRFGNVQDVQTATQDKNFNIRSEIIKSRAKKVLEVNPIFGLGYLHEETSGQFYPDLFVRKGDRPGQVLVGDQSWGNLIAMIGFGGVLLLLIVLFYPILFLIVKKILFKQDITLITVIITLLSDLLVFSFTGPVLVSRIINVSFAYALIIYYSNDFLFQHYQNYLNKKNSTHEYNPI